MNNTKEIKVRDRQTISDPYGDYDVIYVDVMQGEARVRRFVNPISKKGITLSSVIEKAEKFIENNTGDLTPTANN